MKKYILWLEDRKAMLAQFKWTVLLKERYIDLLIEIFSIEKSLKLNFNVLILLMKGSISLITELLLKQVYLLRGTGPRPIHVR